MNATAIVDEAMQAGLDGSHPVTLQAKMLRFKLLKLKAPARSADAVCMRRLRMSRILAALLVVPVLAAVMHMLPAKDSRSPRCRGTPTTTRSNTALRTYQRNRMRPWPQSRPWSRSSMAGLTR